MLFPYTSHGLLLPLLFCCIYAGNVKPREELYTPDYKVYHNLSTITTDIKQLCEKYPKYLTLDESFKSRGGHSQLLLHIANSTDDESLHSTKPKRHILLSFGEHSREFFPIESLLYLLRNITDGTVAKKDSPEFRFSALLLSSIDLYIVAMMNPDGREYVESSKNYCWRGTKTGVDLNRNFDWQFGGKGSSSDKKDEEYRGPYPFSEPEGRVLRKLTDAIKFDAFISLHSGIRQIYVPFADTASKSSHRKPANIDEMLELAHQMSVSTPNKFTYGLAYQLNEYTADGTIFDYMAGKQKIPFSFAIELWGEGDSKKSQCFDLFNPKNQDLQQAVKDVHPLYVTLFHYMMAWQPPNPPMPHLHDINIHNDVSSIAYVLLAALVLTSFAVYCHHHLPSCLRHRHRRIISLRALSSTFATMSLVKQT